MAELNHTIDEKDLERDIEAVPAGPYPAIIESSDYGENKKKTGKGLSLMYQIIDGPYKGRKIFEHLSLEHPKQQTVAIAQQKLNSICVAVGLKGKLQDSIQLHGIPLALEVTVKTSEEFGKQNRIKKHLPISELNKTNGNSTPPEATIEEATETVLVEKKAQVWDK